MSLIEGVGDEVTVGVSVFVVLCLVLLAWFSTHTRDIPFVSIIVVELSQRRNRNRNNGDNAVSGEEGASTQQQLNTGGEIEGVGSTNTEESVGSNNNAQTLSDNEGEPGPSASTKNVVPDYSGKPPCDTDTDKDSQTLETVSNTQGEGSVSAETTEENKLTEKAVELLENTTPVSTINTDSFQSQSRTVAENISPPENISSPVSEEEPVAVTIPEFKADKDSSDEVRRRRVAYFEGGKDSIRSEGGSDGRSCRGAESEQSSVGAQSQAGSDNVSLTQTPSSTAGGVYGRHTTSAPPYSPDSERAKEPEPNSAFTSTVVGTSLSTTDSGTPGVVSESPGIVSESPGVVSESPGIVSESPGVVSESPAPSPDGVSTSATPMEAEVPAGAPGLSPRAGGSTVTDERAATGDNTMGEEEQIRVRLKYLNDTQRLVYAHPHETVGNFRRLHFTSELENNQIVRFIFNGQDLRNDLSTLSAYNVLDNSVVHCLITQNRQEEETSGEPLRGEEDGPQIGELLYPVFGLILGLVWYLRFSYKQWFNAVSTVSLAGVSFVYLLAFFSSIRHQRQPRQHLD